MTETSTAAQPSEPDQGLDRAVPLAVAIERLLLAQLDRVASALAPDDPDANESIHEARKRMKRFRGLIRLVRDRVGDEAYRRENLAIRDVARAIAPVRDGWVLVLTLDQLTADNGRLAASPAIAGLRAELLEAHHRERATILGNADRLASLREATARVGGRVAGWGLSCAGGATAQAGEIAWVEAGLRREYRRGQRGRHRAGQGRDDGAFHEWRKRVKYLRYQLEALQPMRPDVLGPLIASLEALGETLGTEHDLAVLGEAWHRSCGPGDPELLALIARSQQELRGRALELGALLYAESPGDLLERILLR